MKNANGLKTWEEALTAALEAVTKVPPGRRIINISFGTFSDSVGGGRYWCFDAVETFGNTAQAPALIDVATRINRVIRAWSEAVSKDQESTVEAES